MTAKKILTVGLELAHDDTKYASFRSKTSLLDWDIILFKPEITEFVDSYYDTYQGKPSLSDSASFEAKECCEHWRREIKQAVETGKTVLVFLPKLYEVYVDTGQRSYSGTGRNQKTTRHVALFSNYAAIPATLDPIAANGTSMKLASKGSEVLGPYWAEFEGVSSYEVILSATGIPASILTRAGEKPVGAMYRSKASSGTLLLLPDIDFYQKSFFKNKGESQAWSPAAEQFAGAFVSSVVALDKALRATSEVTPEPAWAADSAYQLHPEKQLRIDLLEAERALEAAQKNKETVVEALANAGSLRGLLYEKGKPLEAAIIQALKVVGFKAQPFKDSDSEFDVVFESAEGRLIGEAEGKDTKPINIDKLRQLSMNIHEDLQRDEVSEPAKPVLFGNAFRLQALAERGEPFTEKCHSAAHSSSTALVFTPDLFAVTQQLVKKFDEQYASQVRKALLHSVGRVKFPVPPPLELPSEESASAEAKKP
jgi:hypothetical protein